MSPRLSGPAADANVEAWLVTIVHRKAIDVTRTRARRAIPVAETPDTATAPRRDLELDGDLAGALAALPPETEAGRGLPLPGRARRNRPFAFPAYP